MQWTKTNLCYGHIDYMLHIFTVSASIYLWLFLRWKKPRGHKSNAQSDRIKNANAVFFFGRFEIWREWSIHALNLYINKIHRHQKKFQMKMLATLWFTCSNKTPLFWHPFRVSASAAVYTSFNPWCDAFNAEKTKKKHVLCLL